MIHRVIFGDSLEKAVGTLISIAAQKGTAEAFTKAADGLRGIRVLITSMGLGREIESDLCLRLSNEERRLQQVADTPELLEDIIRALRTNEGRADEADGG
jgi:hypothetical protein